MCASLRAHPLVQLDVRGTPDTPVTMTFGKARFLSGHDDLNDLAAKLGGELKIGVIEQESSIVTGYAVGLACSEYMRSEAP